MRTREAALGVILVLALLAAPLVADAQQPVKVYRIGYLGVSMGGYETNPHPRQCPIQGNPQWQAWLEGLREHGFLPG